MGAARTVASPVGTVLPQSRTNPPPCSRGGSGKCGLWPAAVVPGLMARGPLGEQPCPGFCTWGLIRVGEGRRKLVSPFLSPATCHSEVATRRHLWAVVPHAPHHPAMLPIILLCPLPPCCAPRHPAVLPIIPPHSPPSWLAPGHPAVLCTVGCTLLPPALGQRGTHSASPECAGAVGSAAPCHGEGRELKCSEGCPEMGCSRGPAAEEDEVTAGPAVGRRSRVCGVALEVHWEAGACSTGSWRG